jgi:hypothetical protein
MRVHKNCLFAYIHKEKESVYVIRSISDTKLKSVAANFQINKSTNLPATRRTKSGRQVNTSTNNIHTMPNLASQSTNHHINTSINSSVNNLFRK